MATDSGPPDLGLFDEPHRRQTNDSIPSGSIAHANDKVDKDDVDTCRICRGEGSEEEPLFYPCKCSGSIKYVHQECLMEWLSHTQKKHCELCKTSFRFTKLYHPGMPNRIPTTVFVRRAAWHVFNNFVRLCRAVLVATVWLIVLPFCMRVVWRSLFWVGDGGWSQDILTESTNAEVPRFSKSELQDIRSAVDAAKAQNATQNLTLSNLLMSVSYTPHNTTSATAEEPFLWSFAKRLLFGASPSALSYTVHATPERNHTTTNVNIDTLSLRSPSLLSDVRFFNWFSSRAANRFVIDVLEGQIITLFVVVAFILIFLIREWVVQQQPVINMVALGDNPAVQEAANREQQAQVEVVEEIRDDIEELRDDMQDHEHAGNDVAPLEPTLRRRHRSEALRQAQREAIDRIRAEGLPEDVMQALRVGSKEDILNVLAEHGYTGNLPGQSSSRTTNDAIGGYESDDLSSFRDVHIPTNGEASFPVRTSSLPDQVQEDLFYAESSSSSRPNMPTRDRSFMATEIRRTLEEDNSWSFDKVPLPSEASRPGVRHVPDSWEDEAEAQQEPGSVDPKPASEHSSDSWQQVATVTNNSNQVLEGRGSKDKGKAAVLDPAPVSLTYREGSYKDDADYPRMINEDYHSGSESSFSISDYTPDEPEKTEEVGTVLENVQDGVYEQVEAPGEPAGPQPQPDLPPVDPDATAIDRWIDWMFADVGPTTPNAEEAGNDEHIVRNLAEEAPFVPFAGNQAQNPPNPRGQDPEVAAAAAEAGIDVNDQEAIDDAEDLEGILELIGMQGPIMGLFQNALFSAVLISATLTCAVWLPYLWGKMVILFMGSPVSLFIKLPLQVVATVTDLVVDFTLAMAAGIFYWVSQGTAFVLKLCLWGSWADSIDPSLKAISVPARSLTENALDRIAKLLVDSPLSPRPESFRLSINSHMALRSLQNSTSVAMDGMSAAIGNLFEKAAAQSMPATVLNLLTSIPRSLLANSITLYHQLSSVLAWLWSSKSYKITFNFDLNQHATAAYTAVERWTASDRLIAIFAGYGFFAVAGAIYLKRGSPFSTSRQGQKIELIVSEILQQAGGVLKVILIISIEMLVFPLYCGLLLDLAMLPLFKEASLYTRWQFARESPWTSGFVHWFIGTCYMFHFALFVSMCRKIMRKGVLYFIRDPDDPTFHPVRDVLERSVTTQLRKIAFSALVYGALVIICLGGVIWGLSKVASDVLPIHWTTEAPSLEFPLDLLFYNFLTPVIIKFYKPSESLHTIYRWWFKKCAGLLRLSDFLFGDKIRAEEGEDGRYVRAPASDQARIPKGQEVFVEVDKDNVRKDGKTEGGVHNSDLVTMVYIPPWFRLRIFAFVVTIWVFMGTSGVSVTILPLLFGRYLFSLTLPPTVEMNDIHAFSLGIYTLGSLVYSVYHAFKFIRSLHQSAPDPMATLRTIAATTSRVSLRVLRFTYVWASLIFAIPFLFAVLLELYFLMPLHAYLGPREPHVVHLIQDWTLGFLYSRLAARVVFANRTSRPARAFAAVVRDGYLYPNARIATRAFMLPVLSMFVVAIALPGSLAFATSRTIYLGASEDVRSQVWRFSFPAVGFSLAAMWISREVLRLLVRWRLVVRDEVYLIGERLHNFGEKKAPVPTVAGEAKEKREERGDEAEPLMALI